MNDIPIPQSIAVCPYCDGQLFLIVEEWFFEEEGADGTPTEEGIHLECASERVGDGIDHTARPYVHWLPTYQRVYVRFARFCQVRGGVLYPPPMAQEQQ